MPTAAAVRARIRRAKIVMTAPAGAERLVPVEMVLVVLPLRPVRPTPRA